MSGLIYTPSNDFQSIIEDDEVTSAYQYKINYKNANIKIHNKANESPEHTIIFPNSCSLTLLLDLPHNVLNKLDDYTLNYGPLEYTTSGSIFKESYILPFRPPWNEVDYIVSSSGSPSGSIGFATQSNGDIVILGDDDYNGLTEEGYCTIRVPFLVDSSGSRIYANLEITTKQVQGQTVDVFRYSADPTWLDNAVYPVTIDPSVLLYTTTNTISMYSAFDSKIARSQFGDIVIIQAERTTWRLRALVGDGDNFNNFTTSSFADITTGTTYLDYQSILKADDDNLVCIYRSRNGSNKVSCKSSSDGYTWSPEKNITTGTWNANGVNSVKADNGEIYMFCESGNGTYEMGLFRSVDNAVSWSLLSGATYKTRKWYGALCYNRKDNKIVAVGCDQGGTPGWATQWDIDSETFDFANTAIGASGLPAYDRTISSGMACDNDGNIKIWIRVRYTADSLYRLWQWNWTSGSSIASVSPSIVSAGGSNQVYGTINTSRDGTFHKFATPGSAIAGSGVYYAKGTGGFVEAVTPSGSLNTNQPSFYINNLDEEQNSEFHMSYLQHDGSSTYYWFYNDDLVKFVGPSFMTPIIG